MENDSIILDNDSMKTEFDSMNDSMISVNDSLKITNDSMISENDSIISVNDSIKTIQELSILGTKHIDSYKLNKNRLKTTEFDNITLELMCNKKIYNKVLEKTNPKKFQERIEQISKLEKYSYKIMELTEQLLGSPDTQITNEINNAFEEYSKICIRYFEMKDFEEKCSSNKDHFNEDEDDTLFCKIDNELPYSYWGKTIVKK